MQAQDFHDSVRPGLVTIVPRLRRFANLLVGDRREGSALLARALRRMLAEQHRYQRGTALEVWAFAEIYRHWLHELRAHADPMTLTRTDDQGFEQLFHVEEEDGYLDRLTASFLAGLPPPQRLALLLVYGEGFDYAVAARVLDVSPETLAGRLIRTSAALADRLSQRSEARAGATVEALYPDRGS